MARAGGGSYVETWLAACHYAPRIRKGDWTFDRGVDQAVHIATVRLRCLADRLEAGRSVSRNGPCKTTRCPFSLCSRLVGAVLWFHPLVWLVIRRLQSERERACDDLVLAAGTRPSAYSDHLVKIASAYRCPGWIAATAMTMAGKSELEDRVRCVLDETRNRRGMTTRAAVIAGLLSVGIAMAVATAGRVIVRDAAGRTVATLEIPEGGSAIIETRGNTASEQSLPPNTSRIMAIAGEWPQLSGTSHRNNVSSATQLPNTWNVETGENILWSADQGSQTYGTPVVADGRIFVGTNNGHGYIKRYPKETDLGCLMCFDVATGQFQWQHSNEKLTTGQVHDWPHQGVLSTPVVKGKRLYYLTNRAVVTCLDTEGMRDGNAGPVQDEYIANNEADVVWQYDLIKELGVSPKCISGCSQTTDGNRLCVLTSNGTDASYVNTPSPDAPALCALIWKPENCCGQRRRHSPPMIVNGVVRRLARLLIARASLRRTSCFLDLMGGFTVLTHRAMVSAMPDCCGSSTATPKTPNLNWVDADAGIYMFLCP
ncbi:MAG: PQQ-binding-like beta-propeller repeat protein [Fuerstiella sp.]|nr:PQQ-binding-like beta-propeller repeat protein [Fuerstiella sp.]